MNITIVQTFTDGFTTYQSGQELSVPSEVAQRWIADGKAQADTDGQQSWLSSTEVAATRALVSRAGITADDTGSAWTGAPSLLSFSAVLASGTSTTVLLEVRDSAGTVATAATITADTVSQVLRQALLLRQQSEYRFRRSSGTGTVTITV